MSCLPPSGHPPRWRRVYSTDVYDVKPPRGRRVFGSACGAARRAGRGARRPRVAGAMTEGSDGAARGGPHPPGVLPGRSGGATPGATRARRRVASSSRRPSAEGRRRGRTGGRDGYRLQPDAVSGLGSRGGGRRVCHRCCAAPGALSDRRLLPLQTAGRWLCVGDLSPSGTVGVRGPRLGRRSTGHQLVRPRPPAASPPGSTAGSSKTRTSRPRPGGRGARPVSEPATGGIWLTVDPWRWS